VTLFFLCQALIPNAIAVTKHPMNAQKTGSRNIDFMLTSPLSREIYLLAAELSNFNSNYTLLLKKVMNRLSFWTMFLKKAFFHIIGRL
jgi:hypothetical protein